MLHTHRGLVVLQEIVARESTELIYATGRIHGDAPRRALGIGEKHCMKAMPACPDSPATQTWPLHSGSGP